MNANVNILLENPKTPFNVGSAIRAVSCYDGEGVFYTGDRIDRAMAERATKVANPRKAKRLPREERIREYAPFSNISDEEAVVIMQTIARGGSVVAVELLRGSEPLPYFEHPTGDTLYVFGPEDGTLKKEWRALCHRFVFIPTRHCINLAAAVYTVLYDRQTKEQLAGRLPVLSMEETLA